MSVAEASNPPVAAPKPPSPPKSGGLSTGMLLLLGMLGLVLVFLLLAVFAVRSFIGSTQSLFKTTITYKSAVASTLGDFKKEQKLVVLTVPVTVMMHKMSEKTLGGMLPLGTTEMMMVVDDNRVQYVLRLDGIKEDDFEFEPAKKQVTLHVPMPVVDQDMVSVQSDPEKIHVMTNVGWARLDSSSGEKLRDVARRELRETVLQEGTKPFIQEQAKISAELNLRKLLTPLVRTLEDGVQLKIEFRDADGK